MNPGGLLPLACRPAISVIMPVYNGAPFLGRSIGSVLAQSFFNWELLAVEDGSVDDSYEQLLRFAASDLRIRVFRSAGNTGPSRARNQALGEALADTVTYLDCDDEYYPHYLECVDVWHGRTDVCIFAYDKLGETADRVPTGAVETWDPAQVHRHLLERNITCPLGVAHRRDLLQKAGLFDEGRWYEEDWDLWKRFALAGATFEFSPVRSGRYYVRPDSLSRTQRAPNCVYSGGAESGSRPC